MADKFAALYGVYQLFSNKCCNRRWMIMRLLLRPVVVKELSQTGLSSFCSSAHLWSWSFDPRCTRQVFLVFYRVVSEVRRGGASVSSSSESMLLLHFKKNHLRWGLGIRMIQNLFEGFCSSLWTPWDSLEEVDLLPLQTNNRYLVENGWTLR